MSKYELITDLCESKVFRSRQALEKMGEIEKNNLLYATLLSTLAGSLDYTTSGWAKEYALKTAAFSNFDHFRPSATDLYVLLYASGSKIQKDKMIRMLRGVGKGTVNKSEVQQVLLRMERSLQGLHPRLKTARRAIVGWETASPAIRRQAAQDLILTTQSISRRSETLPYMKQLKNGKRGMFTGRSSTLKKAAAVAGAGLAGFWLGRKMYDPRKSYTWGKRREAIKLDAGNMLAEDRATQLAYIAQKLPEHPAVEKLISVNYINDGISAFVRTKDGNAYEFEIRPARFAKGHADKRGVTEDKAETTPCTWCNATGVDEWGDTCFSCGGVGETYLDGSYAGEEDLWEYRVEEVDDFTEDDS